MRSGQGQQNMRILGLLVVLCAAQTTAGAAAEISNRFSSWSIIIKGDEHISLSSETGNLGIGCSDSMMTYITLVNISDQSAVVWRP
jgi:hypothetical protein